MLSPECPTNTSMVKRNEHWIDLGEYPCGMRELSYDRNKAVEIIPNIVRCGAWQDNDAID